MRNQVHALGSRTDDRPRSAKGRWEQFAAIAKTPFIVAVGFTAIALLASVWLALLWPLANDAAPSRIFPERDRLIDGAQCLCLAAGMI
jgi:hypothetical protein